MMFYSIENFYSCDDIPREFYCKKVPMIDNTKKDRTKDIKNLGLDDIEHLSNDDFLALILMLLLY